MMSSGGLTAVDMFQGKVETTKVSGLLTRSVAGFDPA